ncbi:MAG: stage II sporulation protein M [Chloroflexota bacterium]|nr:stage II sporulation protein M [Chloroflexota bacterium]
MPADESEVAMADQLIVRRRDEWARLEALLVARGGSDSAGQIEELGWRYREASADLALARRAFPTDPATRYLNDLVERAHRKLYRGRRHGLRAIGIFYRDTFPRLFRETFRYTLAAFLTVLAGFVLAYLATFVRPSLAESFVPGGSGVIETIKEGRTWFDTPPAERPFVSSFIMTNNIRVSLLCFAGGVLLGIPTILVLLQNGLQLGSIAGLTQVYGIHGALWSFVAAHGFLELSVIFISGGAGLRVARGIIRPGLLSRRESVALAGRSATLIACGCVPLLIVAGTLEGFVSPSGLPGGVKLAIGLTTAVALYSYLIFAGRDALKT